MHADMIDGDRFFDLAFGTASAAICLLVAAPILYWSLPGRRVSLFGERIDPRYRLQIAYGIFAMAMAGTDFMCRYIPHNELAYVHETFAALTVLLAFTLGPRVLYLVWRQRRVTRTAHYSTR